MNLNQEKSLNSLIKLSVTKVQTLAKKRLRELTEYYNAELDAAFEKEASEFNQKIIEHNASQAKFENFLSKFLPKSWAAKMVNYSPLLSEEDKIAHRERTIKKFKMAVEQHIVYGWEFIPHGKILSKAVLEPAQAWPRLHFLANLEVSGLESPRQPAPIFYLSVNELMTLQGKD